MTLCAPANPANDVTQPAGSRWVRWIWMAIVLGFAVRLVLSVLSIGSNDAGTYFAFAEQIRRVGLLRMYEVNPLFNHPPLPALWAAAVSVVAGNHLWPFAVLLRLAPIAADGLAAGLLYRMKRHRASAWVAAAFACNLDSILVSAFHCNTDPCYAALCLLAVYLIEEHGWHFRGGLALAAAINVKLIPVLLILPLLLACRDRRQATRFVLGLTIGIVPFLPALLIVPHAFLRNFVAYGSYLDRWGVLFFLIGWKHPFNPAVQDRGILIYYHLGKYLILLFVGAWSLLARRLGRWNRYELCAATFALFMILTPGFGVQYTAIIVPLLFAAAPRFGLTYGVVAGVFLLMSYGSLWNWQVPIEAIFTAPMSNRTAYLGAVTWMVVVGFSSWIFLASRRLR